MRPNGTAGTARPRVRECYEALFEEALTAKIVDAFLSVYDALGYGFVEPVYRAALDRELVKRGVSVRREVPVDVRYDGEVVGAFGVDLIVESRVVVVVTASRALHPHDTTRLQNYLRATDLEVGLLLHFGPRATFKRLTAARELAAPPAAIR